MTEEYINRKNSEAEFYQGLTYEQRLVYIEIEKYIIKWRAKEPPTDSAKIAKEIMELFIDGEREEGKR